MAITAKMVKELREATGAGMMDCKKALAATDGDMDKAVEFLREKGLAAMAKKASRIAAEGICDIAVVDDKKGAVVEVNSETDFVAKNADFQAYVKEVVDQALNTKADSIEAFLAEPWAADTTETVEQALSRKIATIGEKLSIRRFEQLEADAVVGYVHGGGRIGVLVGADAEVVNDEVKEALKNVAMQIAALNPKYVCEEEVSAEFLAHEKEVIMAQIENDPKESAKPDKVKAGMVQGRIKKELKEICLVDQVYVKAEDGKQSVGKYLEQVSKEVGGKVAVKKFVRFETGEGLEKKNEDFAAEVAKQMNK
ncbi:Translation elongation factor Ts [Lachnospiraceae bacterium TWA4]|nr:Translation elongation factor Ts [Lachnospiraceae bacterium TWA4]